MNTNTFFILKWHPMFGDFYQSYKVSDNKIVSIDFLNRRTLPCELTPLYRIVTKELYLIEALGNELLFEKFGESYYYAYKDEIDKVKDCCAGFGI